jgi:putative glutamine amidotransferase
MTSAKVNTVHHQGIKDVGEGLVVEARCPEDQVIESVRLQRERDWVFGVQWHPEFHDRTDKSLLDDGPILRDFLNEAKKRRTAGKA